MSILRRQNTPAILTPPAGNGEVPPGPANLDTIQPTHFLYVSASATGKGDGSRDHPFKTIQQAVNAATAGTAIMVEAGEYHENIKLPSVDKGTPAAPIWLISADGQGAAKIIAPSYTTPALYGFGSDNYIIKDFSITGGQNGIEFTQRGTRFTDLAQNIVLVGNSIYNTAEDGIKISQADNVVVVGNTTDKTGQEGIDFLAVNNSLIAYNDVSDAAGSAGIMVKGGSTDDTVAYNSVHDIRRMDGILVGGYTQDQFFVPGFTGYEAKDITVTGNLVYDVENVPLNVLGAVDSVITGNNFESSSDDFRSINVGDGYPGAAVLAHSEDIDISGNIIADAMNYAISPDSQDISITDNAASGVWTTATGPGALPASFRQIGVSTGHRVTALFAVTPVPTGLGPRTTVLSLAPCDYYLTANSDGSYTAYGPGDTQTRIAGGKVLFAATSQTLSLAQFLAGSFNPLVYLASNPDLLVGLGDNQTAAVQHFLLHGYYEGRGPGAFNALEYIASNPDLLTGLGDNQTAALEHYILHGYYEGRQTASFDALEYVASNPDLIPLLGDDQTAALENYILSGYGEGRPTTSFDALEYIASNPDLAIGYGSNAQLGLEHYVLHGYGEGRQIASFDAVAYLLSNPDLEGAGSDAASAELHYLNYGAREGRSPDGAFGSEQTQHVLTPGNALQDTIGTSGDEDWFGITLTAGQSYRISLSGAGAGAGTLADPLLELHAATGKILSRNNDGGPGADSLISFTPAATGVYYLVAASNAPGGTGTYQILAATA